MALVEALRDAGPSDRFYAEAPLVEHFVDVSDPATYVQVPDDWLVVLTDVEGSTRAIEEGRYKDVNAIGVACIVALKNATRGVDLPYVFGGDGATVLVPATVREPVERALRGLCEMAEGAFDLGLRAGIVPVGELRRRGHEVRVARLRTSAHASFAMLAGSGVAEAERLIKASREFAIDRDGPAHADCTGFECRWQPIRSRRGVALSLIVCATALSPAEQAETYRRVIEAVERVAERAGCPVSVESLRLAGLGAPYTQEARVRSGQKSGLGFALAKLRARVLTFIGRCLFWLGLSAGGFDGKRYAGDVVDNTDYRKFDETLRMVLDVSEDELGELEALLAAERERGAVVYGMHKSESALMTCAVSSYDGDHVHFVDGADGGYALAAKQLKAQLRERASG